MFTMIALNKIGISKSKTAKRSFPADVQMICPYQISLQERSIFAVNFRRELIHRNW